MPGLPQYSGEETKRQPSPLVWRHMMEDDAAEGDRFGFFNDFTVLPVTAIDSVLLEAGNVTLSILTTELSGVWKAAMTSTDNLDFQAKLPLGPIVNINPGKGRMAFECCFQISSVVDDVISLAIGLENGLTVADDALKVDNTGVLKTNTINFVGFDTVHVNTGDTGLNAKLTVKHKDAGTAPTELVATAKTLVANIWYRVGITFDGNSTIEFWVDGVSVGKVQYDATNFPENTKLGVVLAGHLGDGTGANILFDWVKCYQLKT